MKFYEIIVSEGKEKVLIFNEGDLPFSVRELEQGLNLKGVEVGDIVIRYDNDVVIHDWAEVVLPVISEKFKNLIESVNKGEAQFFPIIAERKDGKEKHTLYVMNYLSRINAINMSKSKTIGPIWDRSVFMAAINEKKTKNLDIFRLKQTNISIFVSERLANLMKKNKITGIGYHETL